MHREKHSLEKNEIEKGVSIW